MDILKSNIVEYIFQFLAPEDWYCVSLVSKSWWKEVSKFMKIRKKQFYIHLEKQTFKKPFCIRPLFYLKESEEGCDGIIKDCLCLKHKEGKEVCQKCKNRVVSENCFGKFCDFMKCRDYMKKYDEGKLIRVPKYFCRVTGCEKPSDIKKGLCFSHAELLYSSSNVNTETINKIRCVELTKKGERCKKEIKSRIPKCTIHSKKQYSKLSK
jgi:hypothetical protein